MHSKTLTPTTTRNTKAHTDSGATNPTRPICLRRPPPRPPIAKGVGGGAFGHNGTLPRPFACHANDRGARSADRHPRGRPSRPTSILVSARNATAARNTPLWPPPGQAGQCQRASRTLRTARERGKARRRTRDLGQIGKATCIRVLVVFGSFLAFGVDFSGCFCRLRFSVYGVAVCFAHCEGVLKIILKKNYIHNKKIYYRWSKYLWKCTNIYFFQYCKYAILYIENENIDYFENINHDFRYAFAVRKVRRESVCIERSRIFRRAENRIRERVRININFIIRSNFTCVQNELFCVAKVWVNSFVSAFVYAKFPRAFFVGIRSVVFAK